MPRLKWPEWIQLEIDAFRESSEARSLWYYFAVAVSAAAGAGLIAWAVTKQ